MGGRASDASKAIGARAYTTGDRVAFDGRPNLEIAAHEAAHVVQQRQGVQLKGGVGASGDSYERDADAVAAHVVAGRSAESLLDQGLSNPNGTIAERAVQAWGLGDAAAALKDSMGDAAASIKNSMWKGFVRGTSKVNDRIGDLRCRDTPDVPQCTNRDVIKKLRDLKMELWLLDYDHDVARPRDRGYDLANSLQAEILNTISQTMGIRDEEGALSFGMFNADLWGHLALNATSFAVGFTGPLGAGIAGVTSAGLDVYEDYQTNKRVGERIASARYLSATSSELMADVDGALREEDAIVKAIEGPSDVLRVILAEERYADTEALDDAITVAENTTDAGEVEIADRMATRQVNDLFDRYNRHLTRLNEVVDNLNQKVPEAKRKMRKAVNGLRTKYLAWITQNGPIKGNGMLTKHLRLGDREYSEDPDDYSGRISFSGRIGDKQRPLFSDGMYNHMMSLTAAQLSREGIDFSLRIRVSYWNGEIYRIPGYGRSLDFNRQLVASLRTSGYVTIMTEDGALWWDCPAGDDGEIALSAAAYGSFPGKHPELGADLIQAVFDTIRDKPTSDYLDDGKSTMDVPTPQ